MLASIKSSILAIFIVLLISSCGGGGGSSGGSSSRETAVRVIHASVDSSPVSVRVGTTFIREASFLQVTEYVPVPFGPTTFTVERAKMPDIKIGDVTANLIEDTEYTLLVYGQAKESSVKLALIPDVISESVEGRSKIKLINAIDGQASLIMHGTDFSSSEVSFGSSGDYYDTVSGIQNLRVANKQGDTFASLSTDVINRGDVTLVAAGNRSIGVMLLRSYADLD